MKKFVIEADKEHEQLFFHTIIFLFGHSILEEFTETNQSVTMEEHNFLSFYNYLCVNHNIEYSLEEFREKVISQDEETKKFLAKKAGTIITLK